MSQAPVSLAGSAHPGILHEHLATVGSTNAFALERMRELSAHNALEGVWITADRQTAGRGRRGREWVGEPGNLFATYATRLAATASRELGILPLAAAVALAEAVDAACPAAAERLAMKWPNDLLLDGRKVAGILLEAESHGEDGFVAIGFGVNCARAPTGLETGPTSFAASGLACQAQVLFPALARLLGDELRDTRSEAVVERWRRRAHGLGGAIVVRLPKEELTGTFEGMADDGRLVLGKYDGTKQHIAAGDVFFERMQGQDDDNRKHTGGTAP